MEHDKLKEEDAKTRHGEPALLDESDRSESTEHEQDIMEPQTDSFSYIFADAHRWPVDVVYLKPLDVNIVVHEFKHPEPDRPTIVLLPEMLLDARSSWTKFLAHPLIDPIFSELNVTLLNWPHMASPADGEVYDQPHLPYPSFGTLSNIVEEFVRHRHLRGCFVGGVGAGALQAIHLTTFDHGLFKAALLISPPPMLEPMAFKLSLASMQLRSTSSPDSVIPDYYSTRWLQRWFEDSKGHPLPRSRLEGYRAMFRLRLPAYTIREAREISNRIPFEINVKCPVLAVLGREMPPSLVLPRLEKPFFARIDRCTIRGRGLCHIESPRELVGPISEFLNENWEDFHMRPDLLAHSKRSGVQLFKSAVHAVSASRAFEQGASADA
ncbi:Alpha/beta hydrolase family [Carpediemonas membranifera]|uniref:Alpha/beta hydrolase family n=1 Tax=Carpediemonas membranifera TaxID=201153 RepID=A0A8J6B048_9EUKA|nr:Alpha/beta hydrolase family [Carpediemonas membranifera]|eukprot:KAG9390122.1 Alpha/beta hydrolase family [Carpediemonas membranifera]